MVIIYYYTQLWFITHAPDHELLIITHIQAFGTHDLLKIVV